jgi:hypothetical protein
MLTGLGIIAVVACAIAVGLAAVVGLAVKLLVALVLLPIRQIGWILFIPLLIIKTVLGLVAGLVVVPVVLVVGGLLLAVLAFAVVAPLLPFAAAALLIWALVKAASRPAAV